MSNDAREVVKVWGINAPVLAVTMADAEIFLKVVLLAVTILYTAHKWWLTAKRQSTETQEFRKEK